MTKDPDNQSTLQDLLATLNVTMMLAWMYAPTRTMVATLKKSDENSTLQFLSRLVLWHKTKGRKACNESDQGCVVKR